MELMLNIQEVDVPAEQGRSITDRIIEAWRTEYRVIQPRFVSSLSAYANTPPSKKVELDEIVYKESRPGSLIFVLD